MGAPGLVSPSAAPRPRGCWCLIFGTASGFMRDCDVHHAPPAVKRLTQLDGVRGLAILMVLLWHYFVMRLAPNQGTALWAFQKALALTWTGVDLFFVLSGFLITGILLDHRPARNYFRVFYLRRACRILPLYFLLLAVGIIGVAAGVAAIPRFGWLFSGLMPFWSYATFTQNFCMGIRTSFGGNFLSVTWSLAVEEQFYVVIPLLVYVFRRKFAFLVFLAGIFAAPLFRATLPPFYSFVSAPCCADALLSGACLAVLVRSKRFLGLAQHYSGVVLGAGAILVLGAAVQTVREVSLVSSFTHLWMVGLFTVLVLLACLEAPTGLVWLLRIPALVWIGRRSYGIYLLHLPVLGLFYLAWQGRAPHLENLSDLAATGASLAATLVLAAVSFRYLESPILRFGHSFAYAEEPGATNDQAQSKRSAQAPHSWQQKATPQTQARPDISNSTTQC